MSTTTGRQATTAPLVDSAAETSSAPRRGTGENGEPQPWRSAEDAKGWRVIGRGQQRPGGGPPPLIRLTMHLDAAQSECLRREAEQTGLGYDEVMLTLLDQARSRRARQTGNAEGER